MFIWNMNLEFDVIFEVLTVVNIEIAVNQSVMPSAV
jgi:hypothetical protein